MTSEISLKLPSNLLVRSHVLVFEPSNGIRPSLLRSYEKHRAKVATTGGVKGPKELPRLHFLAAWLHAIIIERLRYSPLGWTKKYEFSEGDFIRTIDTIDAWVTKVADGRTNVSPSSLPWRALFVLLGESVYGGRIDNDFDQHLVRSFLSKFFTENSYANNFNMTNEREGEKALQIASGHEQRDFEQWIANMPSTQSPVWLGLPSESQKMIMQAEGEKILHDLIRITDIFEETGNEEEEAAEQEPGSPGNWNKGSKKNNITKVEGAYVPEWARRLLETATVC